ncbi:MAG: TonB-dependent receptor [Chloroflexia bacterium]|nr:TonB-dependent receptor [Chloroflexia bacterium]
MTKTHLLLILILMNFYYAFFAQTEQDTTLESVLDLSIEELMNTKVSIATKSEQKLSEVPSVVTIITAEVIKNSGARYLSDILQYIPGFEFSKGRTGANSIGVRGVKDPLTTSRFLILKDGVPYSDNMYSSGMSNTKQLDLNSIERIEVIRGPGSALYGRNAFIGVVNIITKSGKVKSGIDVYASAGNFNTFDYGASGEINTQTLSAYLSFEKIKTDATDSKLANGMGGESLWNIGADDIFVNTKIKYKDFVFTGFYSDIKNSASIGPFATDSYKRIKAGIYSLDFNKTITTNIDFNAKLYGRNELQIQYLEIFQAGMTDELAPNLPVNAVYPNGMYATPQFDSYTYGTDINANFILFKRNRALIGLQADYYGIKNVKLKSSYDTYNSAPLTYFEAGNTIYRGKDTQIEETRGWIEGNGHDYSNYAIYFQNIYSPINNLNFTLGGRFDIDSEFGSIFNPRIAIVWNTTKKIILKLLYGQAYRAPNSQEQYRKTGFTIGNKDLKPESIKTSEFSIDYNIGKNINTKLVIFYNIIDNMIYAQGITSGTPGAPYSNIGSNTSIGFEYEYKMVINRKSYMFLNYSFTQSENKITHSGLTETNPHPDIAPHKINFGINYKLTRHINLNTNLLYRSNREKYFAISKTTGDYIYDSDGNKTYVSKDDVGDYFLINAKLRLIDLFKTFEISAEVYNLLDEKYFDQDTEYTNQPKREGRQFILSLSYKL